MSRDIGGDKADGRYHDGAQPGAHATADLAHCRREGFVCLVESGNVTKLFENEVAGKVMCEVTAMSMREKRIDTSYDTRNACANDAHATIAPITVNRTSLPSKSKTWSDCVRSV